MRTVKASEVVKGMRVRVEHDRGGATQTLEGVVDDSRSSNFGDGWYIRVGNLLHANVSPDHPVTVLAEPEPEWVEGGLYQLRGEDQWHPVIRRKDRWQGFDGLWTDNHEDAPWEVRPVIVVPAPSDEEREDFLGDWPESDREWQAPANEWTQRVADAIRTQGGAR